MGDVNLPRKSAPPRQWDDYFRGEHGSRNLRIANNFGYWSMMTGGGCTALECMLVDEPKKGDWYVWVTDSGGSGVEADAGDEDFMVGLYRWDDDHGEDYRDAEGLTLIKALELGLEWLHNPPSDEMVRAIDAVAQANFEEWRDSTKKETVPWQVL